MTRSTAFTLNGMLDPIDTLLQHWMKGGGGSMLRDLGIVSVIKLKVKFVSTSFITTEIAISDKTVETFCIISAAFLLRKLFGGALPPSPRQTVLPGSQCGLYYILQHLIKTLDEGSRGEKACLRDLGVVSVIN